MTTPSYVPGATGPADYSFAITPDDEDDLAIVTRAIVVAGAGTVRWHNMRGEVQNSRVPADTPWPIKALRILATGTTATGIEGLA